jgi:phage repressor protein C with HTH and peptisase S24 domain
MTIGSRIREIRGNVARPDFAELLGVSRNTIQGYENDDRAPDGYLIAKICENYNINANWLLFGNGPKSLNKDSETTSTTQFFDSSEFDYIPMVEAQLSAGGGAFVEAEGVKGYYAFRKDWLRKVATSVKDLILMRVIGDSMSPTIQENDTVMVDTGRKDVSEGKIYAIRYDHTIMIKRLAFRPGDKILVISDNKTDYDPYEVAKYDLNIIGQVIFFGRVLISE